MLGHFLKHYYNIIPEKNDLVLVSVNVNAITQSAFQIKRFKT